ncbi:MAG TPA: hypothetical protein VEX38_03520, partial [Fimbriimonadaceae bacterium]|nr:hypothetical protein [Fimbriimonadaceae bacterium]
MQPGGKHSAPDFLRTQSYRQRRERKTYLLLAAVMLPYSYLAGFAMGGAQAGLKLALLFGLPLVLAVMVLRWAQQKLKKLPFLLALAGHASLYTLLLT